MKKEAKIGMFIFIGILILVVFILSVGDLGGLFRKPGYSLFVQFDTAAGLEKGTTVRVAGVPVGYVKGIQLKEGRAEVELSINSEVKIREEAKATLASLGLLGEKYIEILPGEGKGVYQSGDMIKGIPPVSFDQLGTLMFSIGEEVKAVGKILREVVGDKETRKDLRKTLDNMATLSVELREIIQNNKPQLTRSIQSSAQAFQRFDQEMNKVSQDIKELVKLLKNMAEENRENINVNLNKIKELMSETEKSLKLLHDSLQKINRGEGTLGKMITQPQLYQKAEATVDDLQRTVHSVSSIKWDLRMRGEYLARSEGFRSTLSLRVYPTEEKFFLAQIVRDPWREKFVYSAQAGLHWGPFSPRIGIMESKVGVGIDFFLGNERLKFSLEGYDFSRNPRPRLRFRASYTPASSLYLILGVEDFTLAPRRELFLGLGVGF